MTPLFFRKNNIVWSDPCLSSTLTELKTFHRQYKYSYTEANIRINAKIPFCNVLARNCLFTPTFRGFETYFLQITSSIILGQKRTILVGNTTFQPCKFSKWNFRGYDFTQGRIFDFPVDVCMGLIRLQHCSVCANALRECNNVKLGNFWVWQFLSSILFHGASIELSFVTYNLQYEG